MRRPRRVVTPGLIVCLLVSTVGVSHAVRGQSPGVPALVHFYDAVSPDDARSKAALEALATQWDNRYTSMVIDMVRLLRPAARVAIDTPAAEFGGPEPAGPDGDEPSPARADFGGGGTLRPPRSREAITRERVLQFLEKRTGRRFDPQLRGWRTWMWSLPYEPHPAYAEFKGVVYSRIDSRMARFFKPGAKSLIRLDEVDWGGVPVNGIPPLYYPKVVPAAEARYLRDGHVVFGIEVNGEARAYPKRILAWHEMARDRVGGVELHVVYCTLCGTVIPYESVTGNRTWRLGTSGLLYRSNKLMFDEETGSLWSTLEGRPVIGDLVDTGLQLRSRPVVTTTWGEWKATHPNTTVLSLDTGHTRDYSEGAAYREYFSHDELYFQVSETDRALKNKAEVLTLKVRPVAGGTEVPVAISQELLKRQRVYPLEVAGRRFVVTTSRQGANRVYALGSSSVAFQSATGDGEAVLDGDGKTWRITESGLVSPDDDLVQLPRVSAQRGFWFGWRAQYPQTLLLK